MQRGAHPMGLAMARRSDIDWESVEREYRLNLLTVRENAKKHGISPSSIIRKAKSEGWTQDLAKAVKTETKARRQKAIADDIANNAHAIVTECAQANATVVELNAISNSLLIAEHEKGAAAGRQLMAQIIGRAKEIIDDSPKSVSEALERCGDDDEYLARELRKLVGLPVIVDVVGKAIAGHEKASNQERKARNLDDQEPPKDESAIESIVQRMKDYEPDAD